MKKFCFLIILVASLIGCGSDNSKKDAPTPPSNLNLKKTSWYLTDDSTTNCTFGVNFNSETEFVEWYGCIDGNTIFFEANIGEYKTTPDSITFSPKKSTCKGVENGGYDDTVETVKATLKEKVSLGLAYPNGQVHLSYQELDQSVSNFKAIYGCYVEDEFIESQVN